MFEDLLENTQKVQIAEEDTTDVREDDEEIIADTSGRISDEVLYEAVIEIKKVLEGVEDKELLPDIIDAIREEFAISTNGILKDLGVQR